MNINELETLNDNDKIEAFDIALTLAKENDISFEEAYKTVLQRIIEKNKEQVNEQTNENVPSYVEVEEDKNEENIILSSANEEAQRLNEQNIILDSAEVEAQRLNEQNIILDSAEVEAQRIYNAEKEEVGETRSNEDINIMLFEEKENLLKEIHEITDRNGVTFPSAPFVWSAKDGVINDPNFIRNHDYNLTNSSERASLNEKLIELNEKAREQHYFRYATKSDEELEQERNKEIANYQELLEYYKMNKGGWDIKPDFATLSAEYLVSRRSTEYGGYGRDIGPNSNFYDDIYDYANNIKNSLRPNSKYSEQAYKQIIELMTKNIERLESMTPDEFRNYKIGLMQLSPEEYNKFQSDIANKKVVEEPHKTL